MPEVRRHVALTLTGNDDAGAAGAAGAAAAAAGAAGAAGAGAAGAGADAKNKMPLTGSGEHDHLSGTGVAGGSGEEGVHSSQEDAGGRPEKRAKKESHFDTNDNRLEGGGGGVAEGVIEASGAGGKAPAKTNGRGGGGNSGGDGKRSPSQRLKKSTWDPDTVRLDGDGGLPENGLTLGVIEGVAEGGAEEGIGEREALDDSADESTTERQRQMVCGSTDITDIASAGPVWSGPVCMVCGGRGESGGVSCDFCEF